LDSTCETVVRRLASIALEQVEGLALVLVQRVALAVAAQVDALAQVVEVEEVVLPLVVEDAEQQVLLDRPHRLVAERRHLLVPQRSLASRSRSRISWSAMPSSFAHSATGRSRFKAA
jgi:hypothetical protein